MRGWLELASHLHMPLQECQEKTTSSEFMVWRAYLAEDVNRFHRDDYYWAQLAKEIREGFDRIVGMFSGKFEPSKVEDFLIQFKTKGESKPEPKPEDEGDVVAERSANSRAYWFGICGMTE